MQEFLFCLVALVPAAAQGVEIATTVAFTEGPPSTGRATFLAATSCRSNMRLHYHFYPRRSADGMSIDSRGNLYASAGLHRLRGNAGTLDTKCGVYVTSLAAGKLLKFIPIPEDTITNNAFGGPDMRTL